MTNVSPVQRSTLLLPIGTAIGFGLALLAVLISGIVTLRSSRARENAVSLIAHTREVQAELEGLLSGLKDAESAQRGYLLTGSELYLDPLLETEANLPTRLQRLTALVADNPMQLERTDSIRRLAEDRIADLTETVRLRRAGDPGAAQAITQGDRGRSLMDALRTQIATMQATEAALLQARDREWAEAVALSNLITTGSSLLLMVLIGAAAFVMSRDHRARENLAWIRSGQAALAGVMQGSQRLDSLGEQVIAFIARNLQAPVGALYVNEGGRLTRVAGYGTAAADSPRLDSSLAGQAARDARTIVVSDVPPGYLPVTSGLGGREARQLIIAPAIIGGAVEAVVEIGMFRAATPTDREFLDRLLEPVAAAIRGSKDRVRLEALLEETQRQAEELQAQQEELRVNNEELEEQSRALKESQANLESQQAELEQINAHLEEQTHVLEAQKQNLSRAQASLTEKASELQRANQYKSEFLANMSHELRTPLNSSLILATLLAENKEGNLTEEQVTFARTIYEAGNDLLALINDVLDLSKIEAGKVDLAIEPVAIVTTVDSLAKTFEPLAQQKGLAFSVSVAGDVPRLIESDAQRLGQVLKNLLSNAIKFTDRGSVGLDVSMSGTSIRFAVRDTGIGIAEHQQQVIFEAFRQADGSTHRRYGGTGLGLSISRDLAHLLGGDIAVQSASGQGSTFTLTVPVTYAGPRDATAARPAPRPLADVAPPRAPQFQPAPSAAATVHIAAPAIADDRDTVAPSTRRLLIVEDDTRFATILRDLAREKGFHAIVTHTAQVALAAVSAYKPQAVLLDVNLPDQSGLAVLDHLKRDPRTRHLPVHVISVADHAHHALERGAVGYAFKPVKREALLDAFQKLEAKLSQGMRRVLVVEDDERQRASIVQLLASDNVEIVGAPTAADALQHLRQTTFDCVVMDLKLPDLSGGELLEQMAAQDDVSFPPVIVYTGRSLTADEEQQLRRFSKSIIIKDARSPERLLDEVTLFLHQVEATLPLDRQRMLKAVRHRDAALEQRRILVVDDDARNIFALSKILEPRGAKVEIARNGREALTALTKAEAAGDGRIDLVLMDIMMPEMDGLAAMAEIRRNPAWRSLPIIALTAKAMRDDQEKSRAAGANDYIAKPFDVEKLLSLIRVWMPT